MAEEILKIISITGLQTTQEMKPGVIIERIIYIQGIAKRCPDLRQREGMIMRKRRISAILAMALAGSMVLAGCGGSDFTLASEIHNNHKEEETK